MPVTCVPRTQSTVPLSLASRLFLVLAQGALAPDDRARLERVAARSSRAESGGASSSHGAPQAAGRPANYPPMTGDDQRTNEAATVRP
jgi:hypothetical protein